MSGFFNQVFPMFVASAQAKRAQNQMGAQSQFASEAVAPNELMRRRNEFAKQMEMESLRHADQLQQQDLENTRQDAAMTERKAQNEIENTNAKTALNLRTDEYHLRLQEESRKAKEAEAAAVITAEKEKRANEDQTIQRENAKRAAEKFPSELAKSQSDARMAAAKERSDALEEAAGKAVAAAYQESGGALDLVTAARIKAEITGKAKDYETYLKTREEQKKDYDQTQYEHAKDTAMAAFRAQSLEIEKQNFEFRKKNWMQDNADKIKKEDREIWDAAWTKAHQDWQAGYSKGDIWDLPGDEKPGPDGKGFLEKKAEYYYNLFKASKTRTEVSPVAAVTPQAPTAPGGMAAPSIFRAQSGYAG